MSELKRQNNTSYHAQKIYASGLFDARFYKRTYPDVAASNMDALEHYVKYGWKEGRDPSERFSTTGYLLINEDLQSDDLDPLSHYIEFGQNEGRRIVTREGLVVNPKDNSMSLNSIIKILRSKPYLLKRFIEEVRVNGISHAIRLTTFSIARNKSALQGEKVSNPTEKRILRAKEKEYRHDIRQENYQQWIRVIEAPSQMEISARANEIILEYAPLLSVIMPVFNSNLNFLDKAVKSVINQSYRNWQLCICNDASTDPTVADYLASLTCLDQRIVVITREENGHISACSNTAIAASTGEFLCFMDHDDEISPNALFLIAEEINSHRDVNLIYSDQDKIDIYNVRNDPYFKPKFAVDLLRSQNFIDHFAVFRADLVKDLGGLRIGYEGSQDYDLVLRVVDRSTSDQIRHIPHVLYHWRAVPGSIALAPDEKNYAPARSRAALKDHLDRNNIDAQIIAPYPEYSLHRVKYAIKGELPKVSVIIPTRDHRALLAACIDGLIMGTDYQNLEIIVVDNQSTDLDAISYINDLELKGTAKILRYKSEFNYSAINNLARRHATGEMLCFLNNDVYPLNADWLQEMVSHAARPEIGAVGARLLYPSGNVQHAGVFGGYRGLAGHIFRYLPRDNLGPWARAMLIQNFLAVTAACMVVRAELFDRVGGFDEVNLAVVFNDVDFCLRINEIGFRNLFTPYAELTHMESVTRKDLAFESENEYLRHRWKEFVENDPFYNRNLDSFASESMLLPVSNVKA